MKIKSYAGLLAASLMMASYAFADEGLKVICASRAEKPPVLDGVLDDACWKKTEARSDFVPALAGERTVLARPTTIRFVYDDEHLYFGLECQWDDIEILKKGVAEILEKHGPPPAGLCPWKHYVNRYGAEWFVDPGATRENYFQILFNAAGQWVGQFKAMASYPWLFKDHPTIKSAIQGKVWTAELMYPAEGIKTGDEWGVNVCRNDETYFSLWKPVGGAYHNPSMFGTLVIGDYQEWWRVVWTTGAKAALDRMGPMIEAAAVKLPVLRVRYAQAMEKAAAIDAKAKQAPATREDFERVYRLYDDFRVVFKDADSMFRAYQAMEKAR